MRRVRTTGSNRRRHRDVVGDRALRALDRKGELMDRGCALQDEIQQR